MTPVETDRPRFLTPGTVFAVLGASVPGVLQSTVGKSTPLSIALGTLGVAAILVSTVGIWWSERKSDTTRLHGVITLYALLVSSMLFFSEGSAFLVSMPLVSMLVLFLPLSTALALNTGLVALMTACMAPQAKGPMVLLSGAAAYASSVAFVFIFSLIARRERYARRDVERLNKEVAELATSRERNRIAREIHDSLGHYLTIANMQVEAARATTDGREERLTRVQQLLRDGLSELRSSVSLLREGASAPKPLTQALDGLVAECNATGLKAELQTQGPARPLPAEVGFTLFRAAQEALTNVRRHAKASSVNVSLDYSGPRVKLAVTDDGVGLGGGKSPGNGLKGLEERLAQVGGTLAFDAPTNGGFRLTVEVPA